MSSPWFAPNRLASWPRKLQACRAKSSALVLSAIASGSPCPAPSSGLCWSTRPTPLISKVPSASVCPLPPMGGVFGGGRAVGGGRVWGAKFRDLHIKQPKELAYDHVDTAAALSRCVLTLNRLLPRPDLVVISGDLADTPRLEEYEHLKRL